MSFQPDTSPANAPRELPDPLAGMQLAMVLDIGIRLFIWSTALAVALCVGTRMAALWQIPWERLSDLTVAWNAAQLMTHVVIVFNIAYVVVLFLVRCLVPMPEAKPYAMASHRITRDIVKYCILGILTRARYQPPFPGFLVLQLANLPPFFQLLRWKFGPHSKSIFFIDPHFLDPSYLTIGKNVTIGFGATFAAHLQDRKLMLFQPTVIEDDVLIGSHAGIAGGCHIGKGSVVRAYSTVLPGTVIGPYEFWGGMPAVKIQDLKPLTVPAKPARNAGARPEAVAR